MFRFERCILREEAGEAGESGGGGSTGGSPEVGSGGVLTGQSGQGGSNGAEGGSGGETPKPIALAGWKANIPKDFSGDQTLDQLPDTEEGFHSALRTLVNGQKMLGIKGAGGELIAKPQSSWTDDQWNDHFAATGRPENSDGYELKTPENFPEEVKLDEGKIKGWKDFFWKAGLSKSQAEQVMSGYLDSIAQEFSAQGASAETQLAADLTALKEATGDNFPVVTEKANVALIKTEAQGVVEILTQHNLQNNPVITQWLAGIADKIADDSPDGGGDQQLQTEQAKALAQITALKSDQAFVERFMDKRAQGHKEAVAQMEQLRKIAYPG